VRRSEKVALSRNDAFQGIIPTKQSIRMIFIEKPKIEIYHEKNILPIRGFVDKPTNFCTKYL
jgi:hypothetical protein